MVEAQDEYEAQRGRGDTEGRLSGVAWGLVILWIGIVFLLSVASWVALLGIGLITLGMQLVRKAVGLSLEGFWLLVGVFFVLGSVWDLSGTTVPLFPILLILAGLGVLLSILTGRRA